MNQTPIDSSVCYTSFYDFVADLQRFGEAPAITSYDRRGNRSTRSYADLHRDVFALRRALAAAGLAGRRIAICGENSYEWLLAFFAITSAGGVAICVDIEQTDDIVRRSVSFADAEAVFVSASMQPICQPLCAAETGAVTTMISLSSAPGSGLGSIADMLAQGALLPEPELPAIGAQQQAAVIFTSGTTALAKAVMLTHGNLLSNASAAVSVINLGESAFTGLPFYHAYGLNCGVICSLLSGTSLTISGDIRTMLRDLSLSDARTFYAVPLLLEVYWKNARSLLAKHGRLQEADSVIHRINQFGRIARHLLESRCAELHDLCFGSVRTVLCGGAHMNVEIARCLDALNVTVLQGYGITECSPLISVNRPDRPVPETVGPLLPGFDLKFDGDEILIRGPGVMTGYYKDEAATAEALQNGWFRTGDLGELDGNRNLRIIGRSKNLIVLKNGKKISPETIEQMVRRIPLVREAIVYASATGIIADDVKPAVSIYPDPQATAGMSQYEILAALQTAINTLNEKLPSYQQIRMINIREKEFEKTASQKTIRASAQADSIHEKT